MKKLIPILLLAGSAILSGCGDSNDYNQVSGQQGNPNPFTPTPPVAVNDVYATDEDDAITLTAAQGVLANDQVNDQAEYVSVDFPAATAQGGTITQTADTGAFTYTPALGFTGTDSFTYTLTNREGSDTATVTIEVDAAIVAQGYFVDSTNGNDTTADFNTGAPYATIQGAVADAPANATITVRPGNYTGTVTLKDGQTLRGVANSTRPVLAGPVVLADGNILNFLRISGTNGDAIDAIGQNGGTITNCEISNVAGGGDAIEASPSTGNWVIEDNIITNVEGIGIHFTTEGSTSAVLRINRNEITNAEFAALGFTSSDSSQLRAQINDNVLLDTVVPGATFEAIAGGSSVSTFQIIGNENDDVYAFSTTSAAGEINVENYLDLIGLNNNQGTIDTTGSVSSPNDINDAGF